MVSAMKEAFASGVPDLFTVDELRKVVGYEPLEVEGLPTEGDPASA
jgi:hypothetical protein